MRDPINIAVVAIAQMEVITAIQYLAPTVVAVGGYGSDAAGGHAAGLQTDIIDSVIVDHKSITLSTDEAGERAVRAVGCRGDVVDVAAVINGREHPARRIRDVSDGRSAGVGDRGHRTIQVVGVTHGFGYAGDGPLFA